MFYVVVPQNPHLTVFCLLKLKAYQELSHVSATIAWCKSACTHVPARQSRMNGLLKFSANIGRELVASYENHFCWPTEHRNIGYTATGQEAQSNEPKRTDDTNARHKCKTSEAHASGYRRSRMWKQQMNMHEHKLNSREHMRAQSEHGLCLPCYKKGNRSRETRGTGS
jgi:hypothetical protein